VSNTKNIAWRVYLIYVGFIVLLLVVLFKTASIQFGQKSEGTEQTEKLPIRLHYTEPRRGEILDENYTPLLTSLTFYDISLDPTVAHDTIFNDEVSDFAQQFCEMYPDLTTPGSLEYEIRQYRRFKKRFLPIKRKVTHEERKRLLSLPLLKHGRMKGGVIDSKITIVRKRPNGELLARTLGFHTVVKGTEYKVGIEGAYNHYLAGEKGEEIEQRISTGWKKTGQIIKDAVDGADIVLSVNKEIQEVAHSELERQLKFQGAESGTVVLMDVKTGFIKAIVNLSLDTASKKYVERYNFAVGRKEVPGSTFKLASLMAGLEDGKFKLTDTVNAVGSYVFPKTVLKDANDGRGYGRITIQRAFEKSSNVIAQLMRKAYRDDPQQFLTRLEEFGLTKSLGLDIDGEPEPSISRPNMKRWSALSLPWMSIGYEVQQTPLQTLAFYNAVANDGVFVKPQFVKEIRRGAEVVKRFEPVIIKKKICSDETIIQLKSCLEGVMKKGGTGEKLTSSFFTIAGKTGTARITNSKNQYDKDGKHRYQASFVGYFPAKKPIYSCIVVVSAPSKQFYGAVVSGTVFASVANKVYASTLKYHPAINLHKPKKNSVPLIKTAYTADVVRLFKRLGIPYHVNVSGDYVAGTINEGKLKLSNRKITHNRVPNTIGMTARDAVYVIESQGMHAHISGYGRVVSQSIPPGQEVFKGGIVELNLN